MIDLLWPKFNIHLSEEENKTEKFEGTLSNYIIAQKATIFELSIIPCLCKETITWCRRLEVH